MSSLSQNIGRYKSFDNDLRSIIEQAGASIAPNTPCEELIYKVCDLIDASVYGVSGLYSSSPALTRTDDAVGMSYSVNSSTGAVTSDFNSVFPWNEAEVVTLDSGKFLHMPVMYFRIGSDSEGRLTDVAVSKLPRSEGQWYRVEEFWYGCYGASAENEKLASRSGADRMVSAPRSTFRAYAGNTGSGYSQLDLYHHTVMMFLWYIEFATKKSDDVMTGRIGGSGTQGGTTICSTGGTDSLTTPSGFETSYGQMRYHYIEDFIGNVREFVDGVYCSTTGTADYVTSDPASFSDNKAGKTALSYPSPANGCLSALGWDSEKPFLCMPHSVTDSSGYSTYFCDQAYNNTETRSVLCCGSYYRYNITAFGLSCYYRVQAADSYDFLGGRLIKL